MWPFRKKALTGTPEVVSAIRDNWTPIPRLGGGSRQRVLEAYNTAQSANYAWIYTNSPAVRTVIDVLVRNIGQLDLRLYEEVSEAERRPRPDHEAALSLRYPTEDVSSDRLIRCLFKDYLVFDNAYALLEEAPGRQLNIMWIPAHMVEVCGSSLFYAEFYRVWRSDGTWVDYPREEILHWRGENPHDPRMGLSKLDTLRGVTAEDAALQAATVELAQNGLTDAAWVFRPNESPQWSNEARQAFEEDLTNRIRRRNKTPVVLEEGMELKPFGVSPKDAQMFEVRRWAIERVAAEYGVPLGMVGLDDNLDAAQKQFYSDTLPPYCQEFTKMLNQRILVRVYDWTDGCFEFNLDEKLMGDDRLKALTSATGRPVMLTNEGRAKLNLPPVEGGDELVTPLNVVVGEKPSTDVMPVQDPNGPEQDGSYREEPKSLVKADDYEPLPQLHPGLRDELNRQHRAIDSCKAVVERHFTRVMRGLREKADVKPTGRQMRDDWAKWERYLAKDLHGALRAIVELEGGRYALKLGGGEFDMRNVAHYLEAMAESSAGAVNETIRTELDRSGVEGTLAVRGEHVELVGHSLGVKATQWARVEAARHAPLPEARQQTWVPNTTRHAKFGGDSVPLGASWPAGFAPGSAPSCRCTMSIT